MVNVFMCNVFLNTLCFVLNIIFSKLRCTPFKVPKPQQREAPVPIGQLQPQPWHWGIFPSRPVLSGSQNTGDIASRNTGEHLLFADLFLVLRDQSCLLNRWHVPPVSLQLLVMASVHVNGWSTGERGAHSAYVPRRCQTVFSTLLVLKLSSFCPEWTTKPYDGFWPSSKSLRKYQIIRGLPWAHWFRRWEKEDCDSWCHQIARQPVTRLLCGSTSENVLNLWESEPCVKQNTTTKDWSSIRFPNKCHG